MNDPIQMKIFGGLAFIPYYLTWFIITGFYVFISPGLLDPANKIPFY